MKAEELRIGNYVKYRDEWDCEVESLGYTFATHNKDLNDFFYGIRCGSDDLNDYSPIPLTEEWLLKLGFEYDKTKTFLLCKGAFNINTGNHNIWHYGHKVITTPKYVHQLQNLYFALAGEELEYNGL